MRKFSRSLPAIFAFAVLREAEKRGISKQELLVGAGLEPRDLENLEAPLPLDAIFAVWEAAMKLVRDDGLPVAVARTFALEDYPVLGFAVMTSSTIREALGRVVRFHAIVSTSAKWTVEERGELLRLRWHREGPRTLGHRVANESALAELVHATRQALGYEVEPVGVSFRHATPTSLKAHRKHFGPNMTFGARVDEVLFPRSLLDTVPRLANPRLAAHFDAQAELLLAKTAKDASVSDRVRHAVERTLASGEPAASVIAKQLALSERTLRRSLANDGTSFRAIVEAVRRERALLLLEDRRSSLAEIAMSLGFSELSAFSRAFKRWTGKPPSAARA